MIDIRAYDADDLPLSTIAFGELPVGDSDPVTVRIYNGLEGPADTAIGAALIFGERDAGETAYLYDGSKPITGSRRLRVALVSGLGGLTLSPEASVPAGVGAPYLLPDLEEGQGVELELRIFTPADGAPREAELEISVEIGGFVATGALSNAVGYGTYFGVGDGREYGLVEAAEVVADSPASDAVVVGSAGWLWAGIPSYLHSAPLTLDDEDGAAVALSSGESYIAALCAGDGAVEVVKGLLAAQPVGPENRPALTRAQRKNLLAWVERPFSATITASEITDARALRFAALSSAGLTLTVAPSRQFVPGAMIDHQAPETVTLDDDATSEVWRLGSGGLLATTTGRPDPTAWLLATVTTAGGSVTAIDAPRSWIPQPIALSIVVSGVAAEAMAFAVVPHDRQRYIAPHAGAISARFVDAGSSLASGSVVIALEYMAPDATTYSEITSSAARPEIEWDDADLAAYAAPAFCTIPRGSTLRARVVSSDLAGSTLPAGVVVTVELV